MALSQGQRPSHLRSIGSWASAPGLSQAIHFSKAVTLFGRNIRVVDYCLSSPAAATTDLNYISRIHARIIRTDSEYVLVDSSLTGVYVNDIRIQGRVNLHEGDTVTFGHPAGKNLLLGSHTRQPNSPFYFLFEHCDCCPDQMQSVYGDRRNFPQLLKDPDLVSAGVSHPSNLKLAFAHNMPQMTLPGWAPLANSVTQCDHQAALAPPPSPALSASSPVTAPLPTPSQDRPEQSRSPSSSPPPLSAPCGPASQVLRSASPDYSLPEESSLAATESSPRHEDSESSDSVSPSRSRRESAGERDTPRPQGWSPQEDAGRGSLHPLLPGPTCSEASGAADRDGSQKAAEASGLWEETLQITPDSGAAPSFFGPESPALCETDQDEEEAEMNLCPSMEETACLGEPFASEPDSPVEEMEGVDSAGSRAQARRGSVEECRENFTEKHPPEGKAEEDADMEGGESRAVGLSSEIQAPGLGHLQQHDSAKRTAETWFSSGEEPADDSPTETLSPEDLGSERRDALSPSRNSSPGSPSGGVDHTVDSPQKVAASEDVEMEPPTDVGLEGLDGHLGGRALEPAMPPAIPADAEGVGHKAGMVDLCAETQGMQTDGVKPDEMEAAATESFEDVGPNQRPGADGADSKAHEAKETPVLDVQFKGGSFQGEKTDRSEASETTDENLRSKDPLETREGEGRALGTDLLQARPGLRENVVLAGASHASVPEPPENLGEVIAEHCLFFESQVGEGGSVTEGKLGHFESPRSAESSKDSGEETADSKLQDVDEGSESDDDSSLGITDLPVGALSGGEPPSNKSGSERQNQGDSKDPPSEEEPELKRSIIGTSAETNGDAANQPREAEGGLEKGPSRLVEQEEVDAADAAEASLTRSPSPDAAEWSSSGSAGGKGDSSRDGLEEGRIPYLGDCSLAGTQPPSLKSHRDTGERSGSESNHLTEDERFTSLKDEGPGEATAGGEEEEASIPLAATERGFDPRPRQVGSLNGPGGAFSSSSSCAINQCLLDLQELKSDIVEPENLENGLEVKSQGTDVGGELLCLEEPLIQDGACEEPEAPVEQISRPGQDGLLPEESECFGQMAKAPHRTKAGGSTGQPLPSPGLLPSGSVAVKLPGEPTDDSDEALQLPDGDDGLRGRTPASEEEEEAGQFGPTKTDGLHGRRDTSWSDPAEQAANVTESKEAFRDPTEESATRRPGDLAIQEGASAGPPKDSEMLERNLEGQTPSGHDQDRPARAAPSTAGTEPGEPPLKSRERASEAPEKPGGEEMEPDPVNLAGQPEKPPSESASEPAEDGRVACKDQGFIGNASQDLAHESRPVASRVPGQPDTTTVASPLGEAVKELPGSATSSSPQSGDSEYAQKAGVVHQDANRPPGQESACQLGKGPLASAGYRGGLGCSESCEALLQEEEKPRKRPQNEDLDLEGAACHPKKLCRENLPSVGGPGSGPAASPVLPPLPPLKVEQFGKTIEKFLDQCKNRIHLCSDPTERNGDALAQIVRSYFKSTVYAKEPATENGKSEELGVLSSEAAAAKGIACQSEGDAGGPGESPDCDGHGSPAGEEEGAQIPKEVTVSPGGWSAGSSSFAKEEGRGSAGSGQEDLYYFEEEEEERFPMEVSSALGDSGSSFSAESPKSTESTEGPFEEEPDTSPSLDLSTSSQSYEPSPSPHWSTSDQALDGPSEGSGTLSEAGWSPPSDADCYDEDAATPPSMARPWKEDSQTAPRDPQPEPAHALSPAEQEAPGRWLQRGEPGGGDRPDGFACREDPGEAVEEKAAEADWRGRLAGGSSFPQGGPRGSPGPDNMESAPREPPPRAPWESRSKTFQPSSVGCCDPPLKTELTDGESDGPEDCRRNEPPPPSGRAPAASALGGDHPEEGPPTPRPVLPLVKEEPMQEEDQPLPSALSALCPSQAGRPAGTAGRPAETGSPLGKDSRRPEHGEGRAAPHQPFQEAPWIPGTSGCFPAPDACGDQGPGRALPLQGDGSPPAWSPSADPGLCFQTFLEEKNQPWPLLSYPASSSPPSPSVCRHSHVPKTSADEQPEGPWHPADFGGREPGTCQSEEEEEEAGLVEPSDAECLRVAAAVSGPAPPKFKERASVFRGPPARAESPSSCLRGTAESRSPTGWASSEQDVAFQLQECQAVLAEILQALSSVEGVDNAHVEKWRDQIAALQKATKMPQTHIAVVGNTGAGKSCLLNALLDEEAMLPTSAMRACTAVVVEISRAAEGSPYEAEVEFLSQEEWNQELEALLEDMKDKAGVLKKRCPDRKTEAGAAYSRVKAVYGRVDELDKLEDSWGVTQHLGTVKRISAVAAADFRMKIVKFIDSRTDNLREMKGGEFWPIVKCVRIRVATAEVLRTGAVLVDLPGTRDSNAARDTTAREYLKECSAVWVTASITRAVDDKTAKELLSANFRRQLFMDGLYGSLAFVCTKTDSFSISDIVRDLNLQDQIRPLEEELQQLERQRIRAEAEKKHLYDQLEQQKPARTGSAATNAAWLQRHDILEKEFKICALQREKDARLRAISLICVQARNEFSKQRILMDFSAGLQEVSRRAEGEEDGEEEMDEADSAGEQQPVNLEVFTVSSTEYLKLGGKLLCNGQPQVFHDIKDTEIPALKKFAMDTALKHSMVATEKVIRDVARVLSQMVNYLNSQRTEADAHQAQVQEVLQQALQGLPALFQRVLSASSQDLQHAFQALLDSLQNGAEKAKQLSEVIVKGWGLPMFGYPHMTYRAICNHRGVYTSPRCQSVDFNKELAVPIFKVISVAWNEVFSSKLTSCIEGFTAALLDQLSSFFRGLKKELRSHGPVAEALRAIYAQQMEAARARLINFSLDLMSSITRKQRTVSRLLIPTIQAGMDPAYAACAQLNGPGYFRRMKEEMEEFIHQQKDTIFDSAVEKMRQQLDRLQLSICCSLQSVAQELATSIRMQFEPLLRPVQKNKEILPELQRLCATVDKICQRSGVEYLLPTALQPGEPRPPGTEATLPGRGDGAHFPAASMDVQVGALSLPPLTATTQQDLERAGPSGLRPASAPAPIVAVGTAGQQPPHPPPLPGHPCGRKRAGEAILPQLEKKSKVHPAEPAGHPRLTCSPGADVKPTSHSAALLGSCSPEGAFRPGSPPCPMAESPDGESLAVPCSAGVLWVAANQGTCRKPPSVTVKKEEANLPSEIGSRIPHLL